VGDAERLGSDDLVLAHWTMASATFEERCRAASAGGFAGFGILPAVYLEAKAAGARDPDLLAMVGAYGVRMSQLESLSIAGQHTEAAVDEQLDVHWHLAELFGARELGIVVRPGHDRGYQLRRFQQVCDAAASRGIQVGIEFIQQVAAFEDIQTTLAFVEEAERDNAGLIVDTFHHFRGANDWSQLEELPGERVKIVQLSDALMPPECGEYLADTVHDRRVPG
jgi:sugar phosphate isomerase/epimerase